MTQPTGASCSAEAQGRLRLFQVRATREGPGRWSGCDVRGRRQLGASEQPGRGVWGPEDTGSCGEFLTRTDARRHQISKSRTSALRLYLLCPTAPPLLASACLH